MRPRASVESAWSRTVSGRIAGCRCASVRDGLEWFWQIVSEHAGDELAQLGIITAGFGHEGTALGRRQLTCPREELGGLAVFVGSHARHQRI